MGEIKWAQDLKCCNKYGFLMLVCVCARMRVCVCERESIVWIKQTQKTPVRLLRRSSTLELFKPVPDRKGMSILKGTLAEICIRAKIPQCHNRSQNQR